MFEMANRVKREGGYSSTTCVLRPSWTHTYKYLHHARARYKMVLTRNNLLIFYSSFCTQFFPPNLSMLCILLEDIQYICMV